MAIFWLAGPCHLLTVPSSTARRMAVPLAKISSILQRSPNRAMRGFSFVEVIVVVALLGLLVSVGTIVSSDYLNTQQLRVASESIFDAIRQAQADSDSQTNVQPFGVKILLDQVVRFEGASYETRTPSADIIINFPMTVAIPSATEIVFPPGTPFPTQVTTLTIQNERTAIDILINAYGLLEKTERSIGD